MHWWDAASCARATGDSRDTVFFLFESSLTSRTVVHYKCIRINITDADMTTTRARTFSGASPSFRTPVRLGIISKRSFDSPKRFGSQSIINF
mmetsp:Transcript_18493/g.26857  ORF Transcript_18493/g.26857 Transcript_18493/m.26857 type:complete len:92 (-) Transcript_18493:1520-1795(-)